MPTKREIAKRAAINNRLAFVMEKRREYHRQIEVLMAEADAIASTILARRPLQP